MNPNTGEIMAPLELKALAESPILADREKAAEFTITGPEEDIKAVSAAVKERNRRRNKAARKARKANK